MKGKNLQTKKPRRRKNIKRSSITPDNEETIHRQSSGKKYENAVLKVSAQN